VRTFQKLSTHNRRSAPKLSMVKWFVRNSSWVHSLSTEDNLLQGDRSQTGFLRWGISWSAPNCLPQGPHLLESNQTSPKSTLNNGIPSQGTILPLIDRSRLSIPNYFSGESQTVAAWPAHQLQITGNPGYSSTDTVFQTASSVPTYHY